MRGMMRQPYFSFTGGTLAAILFLAAMFFLFVFLPVSIVTEAFGRLGLTPGQGILIFIAILLGRTVNIPVYTSERLVMVPRMPTFQLRMNEFGQPRFDQEPANELRKQMFAVNLGGMVMPLLLSLSFVLKLHLSGETGTSLVAMGGWIGFAAVLVAGGCFAVSRPDPLTGFRVPLVVPALITLLTVAVFVPEPLRPVTAYVAGTMGTLLGGNVIPLLMPGRRNSLVAPIVSIGGAGTFGGVFVAGILAVILA